MANILQKGVLFSIPNHFSIDYLVNKSFSIFVRFHGGTVTHQKDVTVKTYDFSIVSFNGESEVETIQFSNENSHCMLDHVGDSGPISISDCPMARQDRKYWNQFINTFANNNE